jgi:DNA-binding CsgD family transcriptional regulator
MGLMKNALPTFWTEKLTHIFAAGGRAIARSPKKMSLAERIEKAKELKQQELSLGQIAKIMGVTKPTIKNYLEGYPYK